MSPEAHLRDDEFELYDLAVSRCPGRRFASQGTQQLVHLGRPAGGD